MKEKDLQDYLAFLESKKVRAIESGFEIDESELNPALFDFQKHCVKRMLKMGKGGIFAGCGNGKTLIQLEVINRLIHLWSNEGEVVFTPFLGIGSEVYVAVKNKRKGIGCELKDSYFATAVRNIKIAEQQAMQKTLFE